MTTLRSGREPGLWGAHHAMSEAEALSPEKQQQILRGAGAVFAREGYEGASMSRIALEAGVSKGTLYNYFTSKAELFGAYVQQECSQKLATVFEGWAEGLDPACALRVIGERVVRMIVSPIGLTMYRVVVSEAGKFPELARVFYDAGPAQALRQMSSWLAAQHRQGTLAVADPTFAAEQFFALCQTRLAMQCRLQLVHEVSDEAVAEVVAASVRMFLRTYAA